MPRTRVKFCGTMSPPDAAAAAAAGADAIGIILHSGTRRQIDAATAAAVVAALPPYVTAIGVFVNAPLATIFGIAGRLGIADVQLHGDETPADVAALRPVRVIKAIRVDARLDTTLSRWREATANGQLPNLVGILLDGAAGGGTGAANDFDRIVTLQAAGAFAGLPPLIIAGGLTAENVGGVVNRLQPFAVDTSSGIEAEFGHKSVEKMRAFAAAVAQA